MPADLRRVSGHISLDASAQSLHPMAQRARLPRCHATRQKKHRAAPSEDQGSPDQDLRCDAPDVLAGHETMSVPCAKSPPHPEPVAQPCISTFSSSALANLAPLYHTEGIGW